MSGAIFNECPVLLEQKSKDPEFVVARKNVEALLNWSRIQMIVKMVFFFFSFFLGSLLLISSFSPDFFHYSLQNIQPDE